jgi:hypothetical protein
MKARSEKQEILRFAKRISLLLGSSCSMTMQAEQEERTTNFAKGGERENVGVSHHHGLELTLLSCSAGMLKEISWTELRQKDKKKRVVLLFKFLRGEVHIDLYPPSIMRPNAGYYPEWRPETFNELDYLVLFTGFCVAIYFFAKLCGFVTTLVTGLVRWLLILAFVLLPIVFILQLEQVQPWKGQLRRKYDESILLQPLYIFLRDTLIATLNWVRGRRYVDEL